MSEKHAPGNLSDKRALVIGVIAFVISIPLTFSPRASFVEVGVGVVLFAVGFAILFAWLVNAYRFFVKGENWYQNRPEETKTQSF
jgi:hypothetical protein